MTFSSVGLEYGEFHVGYVWAVVYPKLFEQVMERDQFIAERAFAYFPFSMSTVGLPHIVP